MSGTSEVKGESNGEEQRNPALLSLMDLVSQSQISSIRGVVAGILDIIDNPAANVRALKEIIAIDPPLTAKVLKVANSAYFGSRKTISEIDQAVIWIGFDALKEIVLSQKVCEIFEQGHEVEGYSRASLWKHSVAVALLGKMIFRREFGERGENAYAAGLLHDIGLIVEDQLMPYKFREVLQVSKKERKNLIWVEKKVLGFEHAEVGGVISEKWDFPDELSMSITYHHKPDKLGASEFSKLASTLFVCEYLCRGGEFGFGDARYQEEELYRYCLRRLKLSPVALQLILKDMRLEFARMEGRGLFKV
ncbi:MAG: HDOD domain-containing protein [Deltaproteobacteria bacterium]|nr:HDOD domain-containing protein [Deltaproteobacteria bacterium]